MSYDTSFHGVLNPREGATEGAIETALNEILPGDYSENIENGEIVSYEIWGSGRNIDNGKLVSCEIQGKDIYHKEDFAEIAKTFDGQIDFVGEDDSRWTLFLKDGKVGESTLIEVLPKPNETAEQAIGRYIAENGLNIRQIQDALKEFGKEID